MLRSAAAASLLVPAILAAQAPRVTPHGDPSVKNDTIYALAVRPADYPEDAATYLLDDGVVRLEADGRGTRTYRQVVQILKPEAADGFREQRFSYAPKHERLTINWIRVVRPNGEVVSAAPTHVQDSDVPATMGSPVYSDRRVRRVSLTGVEPGTLVDYSVTTEELAPFLPGDFFESWSVTTGLRVARSRFVVDVPAALPVRVRERNLSFPRRETVVNGRRVYTWATKDVPKVKREMFAADSDGVHMTVLLSSPTTWQDISRWYAANARGRYTITPAVASKLAKVEAAAKTRDDSIRAVHRWVAQDVRYVSIALGMGGYRPRAPETVLKTGFGDCKDKATLFVAALATMGVTAYPVLLNSDGGVKRDFPSIEQFDHAIAAIPRAGGGYQFVDLTSELTPFGQLPPSEQGEFALVVHPDGRGEEVTMPADSLAANRSEVHIAGSLSPDGTFDGRYEESAAGANQYGLRDRFENPLDSAQRANVAKGVARQYFEGAEGDSLVGFNGKDLSAVPTQRIRIRHGKAAESNGATAILTNPFQSMGALATAATEMERGDKRRFPIDASRVIGEFTSVAEIRMTLPPGWHATLPPGVAASSIFGRYASTYAQTGQELRLTREMTGAKGIYPPERIGELVQWFKAVGKDDAKFIIIDTGVAARR